MQEQAEVFLLNIMIQKEKWIQYVDPNDLIPGVWHGRIKGKSVIFHGMTHDEASELGDHSDAPTPLFIVPHKNGAVVNSHIELTEAGVVYLNNKKRPDIKSAEDFYRARARDQREKDKKLIDAA